jgi:hypothetical protein
VRPLDFVRQLGSLHGEPGPAGGLRAVRRLVSTFWSVVAEVYLRGGATPDFAPGIEVAFGEPAPLPGPLPGPLPDPLPGPLPGPPAGPSEGRASAAQ